MCLSHSLRAGRICEAGSSGGRDVLMEETLGNYDGLLQRCPELMELQEQICDAVASL